MRLVEVSVLSDPITSVWPTSFRLFACMDFDPCPFFPFLSLFLGCFLFMKFGRGSSSSYFLHALEKVTNFRLRANNSMHIQSFLCQGFQLCQTKICTIAFYSHKFLPKYYCKFGRLGQTVYTSYPVIKKMVGYQQGSQGRLLIISIRIEQKTLPIWYIFHRDIFRPLQVVYFLDDFFKKWPESYKNILCVKICSHRVPSIFKVGYLNWNCG